MKQYKEILLLNSSEIELSTYKYQMDMFGIAEHIHTETSGTSAMYYLRSVVRLPDLVIANLEKGATIDFILELETFLKREKKSTSIVLLYDDEEKEFSRLEHYKQMKKPLCLPELCDDTDWAEALLN